MAHSSPYLVVSVVIHQASGQISGSPTSAAQKRRELGRSPNRAFQNCIRVRSALATRYNR